MESPLTYWPWPVVYCDESTSNTSTTLACFDVLRERDVFAYVSLNLLSKGDWETDTNDGLVFGGTLDCLSLANSTTRSTRVWRSSYCNCAADTLSAFKNGANTCQHESSDCTSLKKFFPSLTSLVWRWSFTNNVWMSLSNASALSSQSFFYSECTTTLDIRLSERVSPSVCMDSDLALLL